LGDRQGIQLVKTSKTPSVIIKGELANPGFPGKWPLNGVM